MAIFYIFYGVLDGYIEEMLAILNFYNVVEKQTMILFLTRFYFYNMTSDKCLAGVIMSHQLSRGPSSGNSLI